MLKRWNFLKTGFYEGINLENPGVSGLPGMALAVVSGGLGYGVGKDHGYKEGYQEGYPDGYLQARREDQHLIGQLQTQINNLRGQLSQSQVENRVLRELIRQQPTTPQAEAILKALQRVEFRLDGFLPNILDNGGGENPLLN